MNDSLVALLVIVIVLLTVLISLQILFAFYEQEVKNFLSRIRFGKKRRNNNVNDLIIFFNNMASSLAKMSLEKVGGLIVVENKDNLAPYINIGNKIDSAFFPEFVNNIFYNHKSALHDGAMIIRN
jgi:diadenylate cyclase